jgi:hypothetical protein
MAKYEFTSASGNRLLEKCLEYNKKMCLGCLPYQVVEEFVNDEEYVSEYAVHKFVTWLKMNAGESSSARIVLGLVAVGLADKIVRDGEFIGAVERFHRAMDVRFGGDNT